MWNASNETFLKRIAAYNFFQCGAYNLCAENTRTLDWEARDGFLALAESYHWKALESLEALQNKDFDYIKSGLGYK